MQRSTTYPIQTSYRITSVAGCGFNPSDPAQRDVDLFGYRAQDRLRNRECRAEGGGRVARRRRLAQRLQIESHVIRDELWCHAFEENRARPDGAVPRVADGGAGTLLGRGRVVRD